MFSISVGYHEYVRGYHDSCWEYHEYSVYQWDVMSTSEDIMIHDASLSLTIGILTVNFSAGTRSSCVQ